MQDINISTVICHHEKLFNMPVFLFIGQYYYKTNKSQTNICIFKQSQRL